MRTKLGKRGDIAGFSWLYLFWRFVVTCFIAIAMVVLIKSYIVAEIDIQETHAELFMHNVLNAKGAIAYYDEDLERINTAMIDVSAFTAANAEQNIDERMEYGEQDIIAAHMTLHTIQGKKLGDVYYNKEWYDRWITVAKTLWEGKGSSTEYNYNKTILLLYENQSLQPGILEFSIVMPNSY